MRKTLMIPASAQQLRRWASHLGVRMAVVLSALLGAGAGCASGPASVRLLIEVLIVPKANNNSPVPITLVAVNDPKLFEKIVQMPAKEWYEKREQMRRDYSGGQAFTEWDWEYVPGQSPPPVVVELDGRAVGAVLFANYRGPGDHRFRLGPYRRMRIELTEDELLVSPLETAAQ